MKVFNWVTRRFLNNVQSCIAVLPDEDMEDDHVNYSKYDIDETKRPMLEDWGDGLLAIGTLAISPLDTGNFEIIEETENINDLDQHNLNLNNNVEKTEEIPLMNLILFTHEPEKKIAHKTKTTQEQEQVVNYVVALDNNDDIDNKAEGQVMKRVTLADLLLERSDYKTVKQLADNKQLPQANLLNKEVIAMSKPSVKTMKPTSRTIRGLAKAKKLIKEDLSPVKKLNQLMKKMMKKKIYPYMEGKMNEDNMNMQPTRSNVIGNPVNDDVRSSLL